jgi:1-acyl-sn-glycerol-3-phosphate acyltransferase
VAAIEDPQEYALRVGAKPSSLKFYGAVTATIRRLLFPYFRVELRGEVENLHADGPLILAPVHRSNLDSMLVGAASTRRTRALAKRSMWNGKPWAWIVSALGAFPVERGTADREALRAARMLLEQGEAMFVFPEGTRQPAGPEIGDMYDGVAYLAAKTGARALPIGIAGTGEAMGPGTKFPKREKVVIHVGDLIDPPQASGKRVTVGDRAAYSERLAETLGELQRAAYAGRGE